MVPVMLPQCTVGVGDADRITGGGQYLSAFAHSSLQKQ